MQLILEFAQEPSDPPKAHPNVWRTLTAAQQSEALAILARLPVKTVVEQSKTVTVVNVKRVSHE